LSEIDKGAHWLDENVGASDFGSWLFWWNGVAQDLATWVDAHEPSACWADYHAQVREGLHGTMADLAALQAAFDAKQSSLATETGAFVKHADALLALPLPAGCK
jgi:hypothetical protein